MYSDNNNIMHNNSELYRLFIASGLNKRQFCKKAGIHINYINPIFNNKFILKDETFSKYQKTYKQSIQDSTKDNISQTGNRNNSSNTSF